MYYINYTIIKIYSFIYVMSNGFRSMDIVSFFLERNPLRNFLQRNSTKNLPTSIGRKDETIFLPKNNCTDIDYNNAKIDL